MNELRPANNVVSLYLYAWPSYSRFKGKLNMTGGGRLCFISKVVEFAKQRNRGPLAILCDLAFSFATSQFSRKREVPQLLWSAKHVCFCKSLFGGWLQYLFASSTSEQSNSTSKKGAVPAVVSNKGHPSNKD